MKQIEMTAGGVTVRIVLRRATIGDDMRKSMLQTQATEKPLSDYAEQVVSWTLYPRCMACVVEGTIRRDLGDGCSEPDWDIRDLKNTDFVKLPAEIGEAWLNAVLELNPSWEFTPPAKEEGEISKKKG